MTRREFEGEYKQRKTQVVDKKKKRAAASAESHGRSAQSADGPLDGFPRLVIFPVSALAKIEVQRLAPPGIYTWRCAHVSWQVHPKPFPRKSRQWALEGEEAAAKYRLRYAWALHLKLHGIPTAQCPVTGLFERLAFLGEPAREKSAQTARRGASAWGPQPTRMAPA